MVLLIPCCMFYLYIIIISVVCASCVQVDFASHGCAQKSVILVNDNFFLVSWATLISDEGCGYPATTTQHLSHMPLFLVGSGQNTQSLPKNK